MIATRTRVTPQQAATELLRRRKACARLIPFAEYTLPTYKTKPYHRLIANLLEQCERREVRRAMIFMPPRYGKSELVSRRFPAWWLGRNPDESVILASYAADLANQHSRAARDILLDKPFEALFGRRGEGPTVALDPESRSVSNWSLARPHRGEMRAAGVGGGLTGFGADLLIIDDPIKDDQAARSERVRMGLKDWYSSVAETRLHPRGVVVIVLTRWHEDDLAGWLLALGEETWTVLRLPALAETQDERDEFNLAHNLPPGEPDPLGRAPGEPLDAERNDIEDLLRRERTNERIFASIWQQRPRPASGILIKREWFKFLNAPPKGVRWVRFWDFAYTEKQTAKHDPDYTCGVKAGIWQVAEDDVRFVIADATRTQVGWHDAKRLIRATAKADGKRTRVRGEQKGNQKAAISDLLTDPELRAYSVRGENLLGDKVSLAQPWIDRAEAGMVYLVRGEWNSWWLDEVEAFPNGKHDDGVDGTSGAYHCATTGSRKITSKKVVGFG